ncbi:MAG: Tat (twin-arginine translocation) pathway signal sequence containing protein [Flavobacteriales bacterium]
MEQTTERSPRRNFLGLLTGSAALVGLAALAAPLRLAAQAKGGGSSPKPTGTKSDADLWFDKIKGTHRVVYDATRPHEIMPFVWPKVFLLTNESTGTPATDCGVVVVLRHDAICYAFQDEMWAKYGFAEVFKAQDHGGAFQAADAATATKTRNPFWNTKPGDFKVPGIGAVDIGIKDLMASGVMFCVCQAAMSVYSAAIGGKMGVDPAVVLKEWTDNLIPGIQPVPSGVWALGRAQEHKCAYVFAG